MICESCLSEIKNDEDYIEFEGVPYHDDCFRLNAYSILDEMDMITHYHNLDEEERDWDADIDDRIYERIAESA